MGHSLSHAIAYFSSHSFSEGYTEVYSEGGSLNVSWFGEAHHDTI